MIFTSVCTCARVYLHVGVCVCVCVYVFVWTEMHAAHTHIHTNKRCKNAMFAQWIPADRAELFPQPAERDSLCGRWTVSQIHMYQAK